MRFLLLAVLLVRAAPLRAAVVAAEAPAAADWTKSQLSDGMKDALRGAGFRLEDNGRVLDPKTRAPLTPDQLAAALTQLSLGAQRLALERLQLALEKNPPDLAAAQALKDNLPQDVARALDARKNLAELRALADRSLERIAAYFDGARTNADRREAAEPVRAGNPGPRVALPYFDAGERALGDSLRAAAAAKLGADPFGRKVLSRLNGPDGKPDLPPVIVADLNGAAAEYDYRRRALIVDRQLLMSAVADGVPAKDRGALAKSLASRQDLIAYLNAHPRAVADFAARNDVLLVHELTHAWQDRRDPILREMARGNLPQAMVVDYEIEAWTVKNLYLHSRLKRAPGAVVDEFELQDYQRMAAGRQAWVLKLRKSYEADVLNALDIESVEAVQRRRVDAARRRAASTRDEQAAKALDLAALTRAQRELRSAAAAEKERLADLAAGDAAKAARESSSVLAAHYLAAAVNADGAVNFAVLIRKAEDFAQISGDRKLLEKVRSLKGRRR